MVFHNESNYDYYFIIKELAKEFEGEFNCLGENTEKCKTSVLITEEFRRIAKYSSFFDCVRYLASSLSNIVDNLAEGIHKTKCKYGHDDKKCETCRIKYKNCLCCLEYTNVKDDSKLYKSLCCNRNHQKKFVENLKNRFANTYKLSNHGINEVILLLRKGIYPYEYMDDWEKFNETSLPEKEDFCSLLNVEDITDADHTNAERVYKDFG